MLIQWDALALKDYTFVIVGCGPAGIHLAENLANAGSVLVIDAGNAGEPLSDGSGYYELSVTGRPYPSLGSRLSAWGGTSNHWGGNCLPLSPDLFTSGPDTAGWPISYEDYAKYLPAAGRLLNLQPFTDPPSPASTERGVFAGYRDLAVAHFQSSFPTARFGQPDAVANFSSVPNVHILTDTRLVDMTLSEDRISSVTLVHRPGGEVATLGVRTIVLAAGAIENARLMLWAGRKLAPGNPLSGGPNKLTGSCFAEKTYFSPVDTFVDGRADMSDAVSHGDFHGYSAWVVSDAFRDRHALPRFAVFPGTATAVISNPDLAAIGAVYAQQSSSYLHIVPAFQFDQAPSRGSYVALDKAKLDRDGIPRAELHWDIPSDEIASYRKAVLLFCGLLNQKGFARSRIRNEYLVEDWTGVDLGYCNHHLGTTRMAVSNRDGVVDPDCKVFGLENLYIAGSSVFPVSGYQNPTLTLVALAGRLAAHLGKTRAQ